MPLEVHTVELRAKDALSPVLKQAGATAQQSAQGMERSFQQTGRSFDEFNRKAAAIGAAIGSATLLMGEWTRAAAEDAANQARLQQAIENTGASYDDFSDSVEKAIAAGQKKAFGDDATRDALVKLNAVTNDTNASINQLGLAMDFARAKGISLSTSAEIIAKVYGGNLGILSRYGIVLDENATSTEALAKIQQISAGQAATYASSQLGQLDQLKDRYGEFTEMLGAHAGRLSEITMLLPGLSAGYAGLAAILSGMGGLAVLGPLGLAAGAGYLAYNAVTAGPGGGIAENALNSGVVKAGNFTGIDALSHFGQQNIDLNDLASVLNAAFYTPEGVKGGDQIKQLLGQLTSNGLVPGYTGGNSDIDISDKVTNTAKRLGMSVGDYVNTVLLPQLLKSGGYLIDPVSNKAIISDQYYGAGGLQNARYLAGGGQIGPGTGTLGYGALSVAGGVRGDPNGFNFRAGPTVGRNISNQPVDYNPEDRSWFQDPARYPLGDFRAGPTANQTDANRFTMAAGKPTDSQAIIAAIGEQNRAYLGLVEGINSANDAQMAFKATQDGLIQAEGQYSGQISEYTGQVNNIEAAHKILQDRQDKGIALTQDQIDFQNKYNEALTRGTGGIEDATIAQGMLSEQYLLNMEKGDAMNAALLGNTDAVGGLVDVIYDLILSMDGVPEEVRAQIFIEQHGGLGLVEELNAALDRFDGRHATAYVDVVGDGTGGVTSTPVYNPGHHALGGMIPAAAHGRMMGNYTLVGDGGQPELIAGGQGGIVIPGGATRALRRTMKGDGVVIQGDVHVHANDPMAFAQALTEQSYGGARG